MTISLVKIRGSRSKPAWAIGNPDSKPNKNNNNKEPQQTNKKI